MSRAIEATGNARGAYIERLRYTIKTYSKNIKELGELAGIEVNADPVRLENDDVQLAQAGEGDIGRLGLAIIGAFRHRR